MIQKIGEALIASLVAAAVIGSLLLQQRSAQPSTIATDVSWPNCKEVPAGTALGIVGVTGGLDNRPNVCVRSEAHWYPSYSLYMNSGWPGSTFHLQFPTYPDVCSRGNTTCLAFNYGYNAAEYAVRYASSQFVQSSTWWIDVETDNSWTTSISQNRAALSGMVSALKKLAFVRSVGFYSYPGQWTQIVGDWRPATPAWAATGTVSRAAAVKACSQKSFTSGKVVYGQYTETYDENYLCVPTS